jgi:hypothetical protein
MEHVIEWYRDGQHFVRKFPEINEDYNECLDYCKENAVMYTLYGTEE